MPHPPLNLSAVFLEHLDDAPWIKAALGLGFLPKHVVQTISTGPSTSQDVTWLESVVQNDHKQGNASLLLLNHALNDQVKSTDVLRRPYREVAAAFDSAVKHGNVHVLIALDQWLNRPEHADEKPQLLSALRTSGYQKTAQDLPFVVWSRVIKKFVDAPPSSRPLMPWLPALSPWAEKDPWPATLEAMNPTQAWLFKKLCTRRLKDVIPRLVDVGFCLDVHLLDHLVTHVENSYSFKTNSPTPIQEQAVTCENLHATLDAVGHQHRWMQGQGDMHKAHSVLSRLRVWADVVHAKGPGLIQSYPKAVQIALEPWELSVAASLGEAPLPRNARPRL